MLRQNKPRALFRFTSLLTVLCVALFGGLLVSFPALSHVNLSWRADQRDKASARAQAEAGLAYMRELIVSFIADRVARASDENMLGYVQGNPFADFETFLRQHLAQSNLYLDSSLSEPIAFIEDQRRGRYLLLQTIETTPLDQAYQIIEIKQFNDDPHHMTIISTGLQGKFTLRKQENYAIAMNPPTVLCRMERESALSR